MTRREILNTALKYVYGDREADYGSPEDNFSSIAKFWETYISARFGVKVNIDAKDAAAMLSLLKVARIASGNFKEDNWIDLAGYAACGGEIEARQPQKGALNDERVQPEYSTNICGGTATSTIHSAIRTEVSAEATTRG